MEPPAASYVPTVRSPNGVHSSGHPRPQPGPQRAGNFTVLLDRSRGERLHQLGFARAYWTNVGEIYRLRQTR